MAQNQGPQQNGARHFGIFQNKNTQITQICISFRKTCGLAIPDNQLLLDVWRCLVLDPPKRAKAMQVDTEYCPRVDDQQVKPGQML